MVIVDDSDHTAPSWTPNNLHRQPSSYRKLKKDIKSIILVSKVQVIPHESQVNELLYF